MTPADKANFIKKLKATNGNVSKACRAAGVGRSTAYDHKKADPDFSRLWDDTIDEIVDSMEEEVFRRAVKGTLKPVFYKGEKVGQIREFSDTLLIFHLKALRPEKFRERFDIAQNIKGELDISISNQIDYIYGENPDETPENR